MKTKKAKTENSQYEKFIDKARELGRDGDEAAFDGKLRRIAQVKPDKDKAPDK